MGIETTRWHGADHLGSTQRSLAYLEAVFADGNLELIAAALEDVERARDLGDAC